MKEKKQELSLLKGILKAELTNQELKIVHLMLKKSVKTVLSTNVEMAKELEIAQPNFQRAMKSLVQKNVIGERGKGHFVKAYGSWGRKND